MPVFPLLTLEWPGNAVEIEATDPAHHAMYEEMLMTGQTRIVAPLSRPVSEDDTGAPSEELRLHSMAVVLQIQDLRWVEPQDGSAGRFVAKHVVVGRAQILRLLNPSALFETDVSGARISYLRAEVEVLQEPTLELVQTAQAKQLIQAWQELRELSERLNEPRLANDEVIKHSVLTMPTWQLMDLWQRLQISSRTHRDLVHVHAALAQWIKGQQSVGQLPTPLPARIDIGRLGAPAPLIKAVLSAKNAEGKDLNNEFWERLLTILANSSTESRRALLLMWVQEEVKLALARAALQGTLG